MVAIVILVVLVALALPTLRPSLQAGRQAVSLGLCRDLAVSVSAYSTDFRETFPFFAAAILADAVAGKLGSPLTIWGAGLYVAGRALYAPLYAAGIPLVRTVAWFVSMIGVVMVIWALFR